MVTKAADREAYPAGAGRVALLAGASGLVGRELLQRLLADGAVAAVHALVRRELAVRHPKLTQHAVDFGALRALPAIDEAYIALGTTITVAGSREAFRAVDFDAVVAVAKAARAAGATRLGVVSAMGADAGSRVFYSRVKGEVEQALAAIGFPALVIARPSLLVGDRTALGQPTRSGEEAGARLARWIGFAIPANYRPIQARQVACALLQTVPQASGRRLLLSGEMQRS